MSDEMNYEYGQTEQTDDTQQKTGAEYGGPIEYGSASQGSADPVD